MQSAKLQCCRFISKICALVKHIITFGKSIEFNSFGSKFSFFINEGLFENFGVLLLPRVRYVVPDKTITFITALSLTAKITIFASDKEQYRVSNRSSYLSDYLMLIDSLSNIATNESGRVCAIVKEIDDHHISGKVLCRTLRRLGHNVVFLNTNKGKSATLFADEIRLANERMFCDFGEFMSNELLETFNCLHDKSSLNRTSALTGNILVYGDTPAHALRLADSNECGVSMFMYDKTDFTSNAESFYNSLDYSEAIITCDPWLLFARPLGSSYLLAPCACSYDCDCYKTLVETAFKACEQQLITRLKQPMIVISCNEKNFRQIVELDCLNNTKLLCLKIVESSDANIDEETSAYCKQRSVPCFELVSNYSDLFSNFEPSLSCRLSELCSNASGVTMLQNELFTGILDPFPSQIAEEFGHVSTYAKHELPSIRLMGSSSADDIRDELFNNMKETLSLATIIDRTPNKYSAIPAILARSADSCSCIWVPSSISSLMSNLEVHNID